MEAWIAAREEAASAVTIFARADVKASALSKFGKLSVVSLSTSGFIGTTFPMAESNTDPAQEQQNDGTQTGEEPTIEPEFPAIRVAIVSQVAPPTQADPIPEHEDHDATPQWKKRLEHAAIGLAVIVALLSAGQLCVMKGQLDEMAGSGAQTDRFIQLYRMQHLQMTKLASETHELAASAQTSANQAVTQAVQTTKLANDTHDLAESSKAQSIATKIIANNAVIQAHASGSSAETAKNSLVLGERPWVGVVDTLEMFEVGGR